MLKKKSLSAINIFILLTVTAIIAYWPVSFLQNSLKWDMIDVVLPFRFFVGECLQNGHLPMWNPYQQLGYPIHADMQCPAWYPETWIIGFLFGYSNLTLHFLFIFYAIAGGFGVYKLATYFKAEQTASFLVAVTFMLSGFYTGHAQALFALIAAAWIPYILFYFIKFSSGFRFKNILKASIFMFLLISNGYQTFTIIFSYILLVLFGFYLFKYLKNKQFAPIKKLLFSNILFLVVSLLLSSVSIITTIQSAPYVDRAAGLPLESALINAMTPQSLLSLLIPFSTVKNPEFFNTDLTMANAYIGLIILVFALHFILSKKSKLMWTWLGIALFCLLASMGEIIPVRKLLYDIVPGMNLFRFPSYFSYFTQLIFLVFAAISINNYFKNPSSETKKLFLISIPFWLVLLGLIIYSGIKIDFSNFTFRSFPSNFHDLLAKSTFQEHIFIQSIIQWVILSLFMILIHMKSLKMNWLFCFLIIAELIISVQLNMFYTIVSHKKPLTLYSQIKELPDGFPIPGGKLKKQNDGSRVFLPVWRNTGIFHKEVHYDAFSSFWLNNYNTLFDQHPLLARKVLENRLVYLADNVYSQNDISDSLVEKTSPQSLFISDSIFTKSNLATIHTPGDTVFLTSFSPDKLELTAISESPGIVTLLQSAYPGWTATVNGHYEDWFMSNYLFMSVKVPAGESQVVFRYSNNWVLISFIISIASLLLSIILSLVNTKRKIY